MKKKEFEEKIKAFPEDIRIAYEHSSRHRKELESSDSCGCFYCLSIYKPKEIEHWLNEGDGTALCPKCGIDSVIGAKSGYPISQKFLEDMHKYWFDI